MVGSVALATSRLVRNPKISSNHAVVRRNVLRKVKQRVERLSSQGPDLAISSQTPLGWRLASAAVLERYPVVVPSLHPFEERYLRGRFVWEASVARPAPEELFISERQSFDGGQSADEAVAEMYVPGSIRTKADDLNDLKSLHRSLRERLYLVVKRSPKSRVYQFPQTLATSDEVPMTSYAELALQSSFPSGNGNSLRVHFISNMPASHLSHVYAEEYQKQTGYYGVKLFFYRAQLISGSISETSLADYAWARESELSDLLSEEMFHAARPLLFGVSNPLDMDTHYEEGDDCARW